MLDFALDTSKGTLFQQKVWRILQQIPYGQTRSYGWVASQLGNPGAARAVGGAIGRNPFHIAVPCHRVINSDGSTGGFSADLEMKLKLLRLEGIFI